MKLLEKIIDKILLSNKNAVPIYVGEDLVAFKIR